MITENFPFGLYVALFYVFQLIPESGSNNMPPLVMNYKKHLLLWFLKQWAKQNRYSLYPHMAVPPYSSPYNLQTVHMQPRKAFQDLLQRSSDRAPTLSSHKIMLYNNLTRSRAMGGNIRNSTDKFKPQITWSEEELDSLWLGVRMAKVTGMPCLSIEVYTLCHGNTQRLDWQVGGRKSPTSLWCICLSA